MSTLPWRPGQGPRGPVPGAGGRLVRWLSGTPGRNARSEPALAAVLFDMDGLLLDSEPLWTVAEQELATRVGGVWTAEIKAACIGKRIDDSVPLMLAGLGQPVTSETVEAAAGFLMERMAELFSADLPVLPGARELLSGLAEAGVPCGLVSSSYRVLVDACLRELGRPSFSVSLAGDEVAEPKPSPQPYRLAAAALGVDPARCVVLEDSATGATAGVAAGCRTVLVPGSSVPPPAVNGGWVEVASLAELSVEKLASLVRAPGGAAAVSR